MQPVDEASAIAISPARPAHLFRGSIEDLDGTIDAADMRAAVDNAKLGCSAQAEGN